jgi:DNA topoisomerase II
MPPAKKTSKQASDDENKYKRYEPHEHVLARPSMYIGSVEKDTVNTWVWSPDEQKMIKKTIEYVPGLYKIYDEILVNAIDHHVRLKTTTASADAKVNLVKKINVTIDKETGKIEVFNDGDGIDILKHSEYDIYIPELIFGNMLTSTNYDDDQERVIGGQNGIGAKACNIFSKFFSIETVDATRKMVYYQEFSNNMCTKSEPVIKKYTKVPYTKITFIPDYERFGTKLSDDMYNLMVKRVYDLCAVTDSDVKVFLNDTKIECKSFETYADLYLGSKSEHKRYYEKVNDRWEIILSETDDGFDHMSFVNGIWTIRGGKHVECVVNQVVKKVSDYINKKKKDANVKPQFIRDNIFVFIKTTISNPTFDSQTKETLTTPMSKFGSKCDVPEKLITKFCSPSLMDKLMTMSTMENEKSMKKTDGKKKNTIRGIPKLDDANLAGSQKSAECTLILTEGDSAKSMAIAGLSVVGRDKYGVFPLRGKLLNVKDVSEKKIIENEEIANLKKILGLETKKNYADVTELRYGRIMVMTDQDYDGFHIKGLIFNLFHSLWPSLIRQPHFLCSMLTPIVKVRKASQMHSFYNIADFKAWSEANNGGHGWDVKYYKGLGTSTDKEAKEYFRELKMLNYNWSDDDHCSESLELAFNKKRADDRKRWIGNYEREVNIDYTQPEVNFTDYVNKELIHFSVYNLERSIPSLCDGLKRTPRKIMYCCFKRNLVKEIRVAQLAGYVSEHGAYHHGEASLQEAIITMAQDFTGSNNINLLMPNGQFGTRLEAGKDSASPRYIHTELNKIAFTIYSKHDHAIVNFQEEDGETIEPDYYLPVIPMVLVNGVNGIGSGFSTTIPNYNPREIVACLHLIIQAGSSEVELPELVPWYHGFKGTIMKPANQEQYVSRGVFTKVSDTKVEITELPIGTWTSDYKEFLEGYLEKHPKVLKDYESHYTAKDVRFVLHFHPGTLAPLMAIDSKNGFTRFENEFKLNTTKGLSLTNMHLYDENGCIRLFRSPQEIIRSYFRVRMDGYVRRKKHLLQTLERELFYLRAKVRFIIQVIDKTIIVFDKKKSELLAILVEGEFPMLDDSYDYLIKIPIYNLTYEKKEELLNELKKKEEFLEECRNKTEAQMWLDDLHVFEEAYAKYVEERDRRDDGEEGACNSGKPKGRGKTTKKK